jgi:transposase
VNPSPEAANAAATPRRAAGLRTGTLHAAQLGAQAQVDGGTRVGVTTDEATRIKELERENRELRRANEILKSAANFFAAELDRPPTR